MSDKNAPYQYGEIVEITIREATVRDFKRGYLYVDIPGNDLSTRLPLGEGKTGDASVRVLVIQPADGPARPGDIWRTPAGVRWFAYEELHFGKVALFLTSGELRGHSLAEICESYGTPMLEYRVPPPVEPPCNVCQGTGWIHHEGQPGGPPASTYGCPDCEVGRARLANCETPEVLV